MPERTLEELYGSCWGPAKAKFYQIDQSGFGKSNSVLEKIVFSELFSAGLCAQIMGYNSSSAASRKLNDLGCDYIIWRGKRRYYFKDVERIVDIMVATREHKKAQRAAAVEAMIKLAAAQAEKRMAKRLSRNARGNSSANPG